LLALLNLSTIALAERDLDETQGFPTLGARTTTIERAVRFGAGSLLVGSIGCAVGFGRYRDWFVAIAACSVLLALLNRWRARLDPNHHHLAADAVLLVPFLLG
jgi:hypothetical protein